MVNMTWSWLLVDEGKINMESNMSQNERQAEKPLPPNCQNDVKLSISFKRSHWDMEVLKSKVTLKKQQKTSKKRLSNLTTSIQKSICFRSFNGFFPTQLMT